MKKIIDGKMYDTETAKNIGEYWNGIPMNDFGHASTTLYRTKNGTYFLYGEGGPQTEYAECHGNTFSDGELIRPFSEKTAKAWAEEKLDAEEYIKAFGEVEEA